MIKSLQNNKKLGNCNVILPYQLSHFSDFFFTAHHTSQNFRAHNNDINVE